MTRVGLILVACLMMACSSTDPDGSPSEPQLMELSSKDAAKCRTQPRLRPLCGIRVPEATEEEGFAHQASAEKWGPGVSLFSVQWGAPYRNQLNERDRPPRFSHVALLAGDVRRDSFSFTWPGDPPEVEGDRPAKSLGERTWGERTGELLLAPPYPYGGLHGAHLIFRWRESGDTYVISMHAWDPLEESERYLEETVRSIP